MKDGSTNIPYVFLPLLCLIHLRCLLSVFFSKRIKDEDRAVRSSNWNLRLTPPKCHALSLNKASYFRGEEVGIETRYPAPLDSHDPHEFLSRLAEATCKQEKLGISKQEVAHTNPYESMGRLHIYMTWMVDFYGKCSENIPVTWILWESLPKQFCWVRSWSICHLA